MSDRRDAASIIVAHLSLTPIADHEIAHALDPATFGPGARTVRIGEELLQLEQLADLDWARQHDALIRDVETKLDPVLRECAGHIYYFGMPAIPLAIEIGSRIGPARKVIAHQQRHDSKSWRWPSDQQTVNAAVRGVPDFVCLAKGDVIIRVSCSHVVSDGDGREVVPYALGDLHVEVENPHEEVLQSEADVTRVAAEFGKALDCVRRLFPNCETVHVFAAVPPALAVRMGTEINPTIHRPVQTYQFNGRTRPRYTRAMIVGERPRPKLSDPQRAAAKRGREAFAKALVQLQTMASANDAADGWLEELLGRAAAPLPGPLRKLGSLGHNRAIVGASVAMDRHEADGEFRLDSNARAWIFDDRLLAALADRLEGDALLQAGRVFFLHEAIHVARQGVTSATAEGIGRLPRVLEDADYLADVWALLHEYARAVRASETSETEAATFFREVLAVATATFWAFDAGDLPLRTVQVRRLNRYLIWYWQRLELERADTLEDVLLNLANKPVLEIAGPRVIASRNRVMFDLDPAHFDDVELGALIDGFRVVRIGSRPGARVSRLLEAVRVGSEDDFVEALRGVFDSIHG